MSQALYESQVRKAERIGRLAADEGLDHEAAHKVAEETERLAATEAADFVRRARPRWMDLLLGGGALLAIGVFVTRIMTGTFELSLASLIGLLGLVLVTIDLIWGSSFLRLGVALRLPWLYRTPAPVRLAVLEGYTEQRRLLGLPGCECIAALEPDDSGDADD
ncbi:hypothetical protein [Agrococcus citreus]|uniref:Uncharacterized protein n=1 Tax=Agrococcus citreus TaxID=84643 RepID=A0ABN1YN46_9MICO